MPGRTEFAEWLDNERIQRGWNKSELARRVGKLPSVVSRWLTAEWGPDATSCLNIANALGVDIDFVLALAGHETRARHPESTNARQLASMIPYIDWAKPSRYSTISGLFRMYRAEDEAAVEATNRPKAARASSGTE